MKPILHITKYRKLMHLVKYEKVNEANSLEELAEVIESFADENGLIQGRTQKFDTLAMANYCRRFEYYPDHVLTRNWGIRQQAIMLLKQGKIQ